MALFLLSCTAVWFVFGQEGVASPVELRPYMLLVFVIWVVLRFGPRGTVTLLGMFSVIVIVCTAAGIGSFPLRGANPSLRLLAVQVYLAVVALTGMVLAVVVAQQEESRFLLHAVVEGTSDAVYVKDRRGRYVLFNAASARVTGRKASEVIGNDDTFLFPPDEAKVVMQEDQTVMASAAVRTYEERVTGGAGQSLVFLSTKGPLHSKSGEVFGLFGIARDITERKRAEEQKARLEAQVQEARKMESVGRLAGGVAHNYNNRLAGILNYVELCRDSLPPEHPVRGYLDEITSDAQHAADLTRQLLSFACKQTIAPRVIDLNDTVANMLGLLRSLLGVKIGMVWCPGAGVWPVKLDPAQVGQLLANLCANAHDAIEAVGGVGQVTIETGHTVVDQARCAGHPDAVPGDYVLLAVSDSGGGMDKKDVSRVFEPFFNTPVPGVGTGLALASAYGIVRQNRGFIEVSSESGRGTCFRILLPRAVLS
jgi:PAS domain S-box-containing protein